MEVLVNRVGDLHHVIGRLPTMISRVLFEQVPEILSFWKWGAVIIAVYAIVNNLLVSFKLEFVRFRNRQSAVTKALLSYTTDEDYSSDEDDDGDDHSVSSSSVNEDEYSEDDDEKVEKVRVRNDGVFSSLFDFRVADSSEFEKDSDEEGEDEDVTCQFTWSNFANGKSVVKLWDGIGLGLDLNNASGSIVSIHNLSNPSVILSAGKDVKTSHRFLSLIDTRVEKQQVIRNWSSEKESGERVRVVDLRKGMEEVVAEDAAEWSGVTWWDADEGVDDVAGL